GASDLGLDKRLKGGAADLYGASALVDRAPRCQVTMASAEAGTTASFKANHEGEAVAGDFLPAWSGFVLNSSRIRLQRGVGACRLCASRCGGPGLRCFAPAPLRLPCL